MAHNDYTGQHAPFGYMPQYGDNTMASSHNHQQQHSQQSILDQSDSAFMADFFDNPEATSGNDMFTFGMDSKQPDTSNFGGGFAYDANATIHDPSSTLAGDQGGNYQTHSQQHHNQYHSGEDVQGLFGTNEQSHDNAPDDLRAASWLANLAGTGPGHDYSHGMTPNSFGTSTWGSFGAPATMPAPDNIQSPLTSSGRNSTGSSIFTPTTQGHSSMQQTFRQLNPAQQAYAQAQSMQLHNQQHQQQQHRHPRARHSVSAIDTGNGYQFYSEPQLQQLRMSQSAHPQSQQQNRPGAIRFGSDQYFSHMGYQPPGYVPPEHDKHANLLNVPLVTQAAQAAHMQAQAQAFRPNAQQQQMQIRHQQRHSMHDPHSTVSSPGGIGGLPIQSPAPGPRRLQNAWTAPQARNAVEDYEADFEETRPHKRRKSRMDDEDEEEYVPPTIERGNIPKRGPKVPKAEGADLDDYQAYATPSARTTGKRRQSTATSRPSMSIAESMSPSVSVAESPMPGSSAKKKVREAKPRQNLSEAEKRENHIRSEQKRRNLIKEAFEEINRLVPSLQGGQAGFSKSEILRETAIHLEQLVAGNAAMDQYMGGLGGGDSGGGADNEIEAYG